MIFPKNAPIRLRGASLAALRNECLDRDRYQCQECGRCVTDNVPDWAVTKAHMAHIKSRGAGGADALDNVRLLCGKCHLVDEHMGGKVVPSKH